MIIFYLLPSFSFSSLFYRCSPSLCRLPIDSKGWLHRLEHKPNTPVQISGDTTCENLANKESKAKIRMTPPTQLVFAMTIFAVGLFACVGAATSSLETCRSAGFDPYQLACSTCNLLPAANQETCRSCCVSYKTLEKSATRYGAAVLLHPRQFGGYFKDLSEMVDEDWDELLKQKGSDRLVMKDVSMTSRRPSLLWFHEKDLPSDIENISVEDLEVLAAEKVDLQGWKRDDIREMIKAIVYDPVVA